MISSHRNLYLWLLIILAAILVVFPFLKYDETGRLLLTLLFLLVMLYALRILAEKRRVFWAGVTLVCAALCSVPLLHMGMGLPPAATSAVLYTCGACYIAFFILVMATLLMNIFSGHRVTSDKIYAAISCYLLLGMFWAIVFMMIENIDPAAFGRVMPLWGGSAAEIVYFSFCTLTTLGYGDITPQTTVAQTACYLEAVMGQLYVAILIARLVGLNIVHTSRSDEEGKNE